MIDTHCHLTFPEYQNRVPDVLAAAHAAGVTGAITISTTTSDALATTALARQFAHLNLFASAGVHPLYSHEPHSWPDLLAAAADPRCVAFGELGLDRHYPTPPFDLQLKVLHEQLRVILDSRIPKPLIIHCREAFDDLLPILGAAGISPDRFVFHCFTGTPAQARAVLDFGALISFTGIVTFKNSADIQTAARLVPDDRIMIETDAPFLSPEPVRKIRPNEPQYAIHTARFIAALRNQPWPDFHALINANTTRFFGIHAQ